MLRAALLLIALLLSPAVRAETPEEAARGLYARFVAAQNARDLAGVRALLSTDPAFLWVSDGQSFWGREVMLARMASFQEAPLWRVTPDLASAQAIVVTADSAVLHLRLELAIGDPAAPDRLPFLVSMLCRREAAGWRILALFTTTEKRP
jgi:ketosteroid isomerase-like protein